MRALGTAQRKSAPATAILRKPRRMRPLTVPTGVSSMLAISVWRIAAVVGKRDDTALLGGKAAECREQFAGALAPAHLMVGALARLQQILDLSIRIGEVVRDALTQDVDRAVAHDPQHPSPDVATPAVEVPAAAPKRQERLLDDLFGDRTPAAHLRCERQERRWRDGRRALRTRSDRRARRAPSGHRQESRTETARGRLQRTPCGRAGWGRTCVRSDRYRPDTPLGTLSSSSILPDSRNSSEGRHSEPCEAKLQANSDDQCARSVKTEGRRARQSE